MMLSLFFLFGCSVFGSKKSSKVNAPVEIKEEFHLPESIRFTGYAPSAGIATVYGRSIAVVVGIEDYQTFPDREGAARASSDIASELMKRGFEVKHFVNSDATRKNLQQHLYVDLPLMVGENDRVLVYFVGRGKKDSQDAAVFLPYDANDEHDGFSLRIFASLLEESNAKHTMIINDAIDVGILRSPGSLIPDRDWNVCTRERKHTYFAASETQSPQLLATSFLEGLSGSGDLNGDGISVDDELFSQLHTNNPTYRWEATGIGCLGFKNDKVKRVRDTRFKVYPSKRLSSGSFKMGSSNQNIAVLQRRDELQHEVRISRDFYVGETEVTYALLAAMGKTLPKGVEASEPIRNLSWIDSVTLANELSVFEGAKPCYEISGNDVSWPQRFECDGWRLPTESEWEYLARAKSTEHFSTPNGEGALPRELEEQNLCSDLALSDGTHVQDLAWFCGNAQKKNHPVKEKSPNAFGLYDTAGNLWEWTWDWYAPYPDGILDDPVGPHLTKHLCSKDKPGRVLRGGSYVNDIATIRPSFRYCAVPERSDATIGLRLVRTAKD